MMDSLEVQVREWGKEKGIFDYSDAVAQMDKMEEEVDELFDEVIDYAGFQTSDTEKVKGELGDVLVTCIIQAHFHGLSLQSCLQTAVDKITKRTGRMVDGQFVKDS